MTKRLQACNDGSISHLRYTYKLQLSFQKVKAQGLKPELKMLDYENITFS